MPTQKECIVCKKKIGVASKTCARCGAKQPYKQKLENIKRKLSHGWKERQKKNSSVNKVYDATDLLLHKWELLERHPMLLLARRTTNGFLAECFCPWQMSCEGGKDTISTIKRIYESLLNGNYDAASLLQKTALLPVALASGAVGGSGQRPPSDSAEPPPPSPPSPPPDHHVLPAAITADPGSVSMSPPLLRPQLSSDFFSPASSSLVPPLPPPSSFSSSSHIHPLSSSSSSSLTRPVSLSSFTPSVSSPLVSPPSPTLSVSPRSSPAPVSTPSDSSDSSESPTWTRARERRRQEPSECPVHQRCTSFPYRRILGERIREGRAEVLVQWYPCSGCGERWKNTWEPKENILS